MNKGTVKALGAKGNSTNKKWIAINCKMNGVLRTYVNVKNIYLGIPYEIKNNAKNGPTTEYQCTRSAITQIMEVGRG